MSLICVQVWSNLSEKCLKKVIIETGTVQGILQNIKLVLILSWAETLQVLYLYDEMLLASLYKSLSFTVDTQKAVKPFWSSFWTRSESLICSNEKILKHQCGQKYIRWNHFIVLQAAC